MSAPDATCTPAPGDAVTASVPVAVASNTFSNDDSLRAALSARFPAAFYNHTGRVLAGEELVAFLRPGAAAIMGLERIDAALLDACPSLRVIAKFGVGLDNVDLPGCAQRGIAVLSTPGVNALAVAELTLGLMIGVARRIAIATHHLKSGRWVRHGGVQVLGKRVGLIGLGNVGRQTARVLRAVGCQVLAHDLLDLREYCAVHGLEQCTFDEVLRQSDFVSLHVPLTGRTRSLIRRDQLRAMRPTAFLINTSRGGIVDEDDLADALEQGVIAGAATDVFAEEPTRNTRLLALDNFIGTAHVGGNSREAIHAVGTAAIENLLRHFALTAT
jgi:D-3-phosphoglycerate dehydrogenase